MTYQQIVFKRYHSDKRFSEFLPTRWQQKSTATNMEQNYVTVILCIVDKDFCIICPSVKLFFSLKSFYKHLFALLKSALLFINDEI